MTTITIVPNFTLNGADYRAVAGAKQSVGRTPGEALDAITAQLSSDEAGTLVVVQSLRPDAFFTVEQCKRLDDLMTQWRTARDRGQRLDPAEQAELAALTTAELEAATRRAAELANGLEQ